MARARSLQVPGLVTGFQTPVRPTLTSIENQIRALPGLIHLIDPADFSEPNVLVRDKASGAPMFFGAGGTITKVADGGVPWNNKPCLRSTDKLSHMLLTPEGAPPSSFTVMMVMKGADGDVFTEASSTFMCTYGPGTTASGRDWQFNYAKPNAGNDDGRGLHFYSRFIGTTENRNGPIGGINVGGGREIWRFTYDAPTKTSHLYGHTESVVPISTKTDHELDPFCNPGSHFSFFGWPNGSNGARMDLGLTLIFDRALDKPSGGATAAFAQARSLLSEFYA